ncbi:MAG: hypothetical protein VX475_21725 [Myxococcota bacterium]|nr:hypothetical protein [Myxococcota bacterium]
MMILRLGIPGILANVYDGSSCCLAPITNPGAMLQNRRGGYAW